MKSFFFIFIIVISNYSFTQNDSVFFSKADRFFKTYTIDNKVKYQAIKNNTFDLDELINYIATQNVKSSHKKAYLINAYNLLVIHKIVKNYPISSPNDVYSFFDTKDNIINHQLYSLNEIENKLLRQKYEDFRLHFVLVCGAVSCPPISNFAYQPNELDKQLNQQTTLALNNSQFVYQNTKNKTIFLSQIFNWYPFDFGKNNKETIHIINQYRTQPFDSTYHVKYYNYNWQLNDFSQQIDSGDEKSSLTLPLLIPFIVKITQIGKG